MKAIQNFGRSVLQFKQTNVGTIGKRAVLLTVPLSLLFGLVLSIIPTNVASAAVPKLRWIDSYTIEVSGGDLKGNYTISDQATKQPGVAFFGKTDVQHKDGCNIGLSINIREGKNNTDYSKANLFPGAPGSGTNCFTNGPNRTPGYYYMGISTSKSYTVAEVGNRSKEGEQKPDPVVDDPTDKQIVKVGLYPGWPTIYNTPNPSSPPRADELVPQEDLWVLCGDNDDPTRGWEPYTTNGSTDFDQMENDCLARKGGFVIGSTRGPIQVKNSAPKIKYEGQFTGVKAGAYVVCDFITSSCIPFQKEPGKVASFTSWPGTPSPTAEVPGSNTDTEGTVDEPELACDITFDLTTIFSLKWLVCPVINAATTAVGVLDDVINNLLKVDVEDIFDDSDSTNAYHKAWNSFRAFALGLIVIAALVMVVGQAAGMEVLDAYTVRKVLPRLLFAAIFITLSWDILEFLTQLSNDAGKGIRTIIYAPFQGLSKNNQLGGGSSFSLALIGTGGALAFGWIGLLSFALTGLLAALVAFAVLVFRKMLILLLVMMAPFAIACYVLPNTQKGWEIWKGALLSALIVFPIIAGFIAIGRVFSVTAYNSPGIQTVNQIIAVIAYFAPYFLISMAFRLAGGFIATIGGVVNDRSRGAFDRLKNLRGNEVNKNMSRMAAGTRFQSKNPLASTFNAATGGIGTYARSRSKVGFLTNKGIRDAAFAQQRALNAMAYAKTDAAQVGAENDLINRGQSYLNEAEHRKNMAKDFELTGTPEEIQKQIDQSVAAVKANGGYGRDQQINAARRLFATGTGYDNLEQVQKTISRVAGKNEGIAADILGYGNKAASDTGRLDLKPGYNTMMNLYRKGQSKEGLKQTDFDAAYMDSIKGNEALAMLRGKPIAVKNIMPVLSKALKNAKDLAADGDTDAQIEVGRLTGIMEQFQQSSQLYASAVNTQTVNEQGVRPTKAIREDVTQQGSPVVYIRQNGKLVPTNQYKPAEEVNINIQRGLEEQSPRSMPNDPRNAGLL